MPKFSVRVLRLRPINQQRDGLPQTELGALARAFKPRSQQLDQERRTIKFESEVGPTPATVQEVRDFVESALGAADVLILDLNFRIKGRQTLPLALAMVFSQLRDAATRESLKILVLMDTLRNQTDPLMRELSGAPWLGMTHIVNARGIAAPNPHGWALRDNIRAACELSEEVLAQTVRRRIVRLSGVYEHAHSSGHYYSEFRYVAEPGRDVLTALLSRHVETAGYDVILTPDDASQWFVTCVTQVAAEKRVGWLTPAEVAERSSEDN